MNAERSIASQRDGVRFILEMLDRHGPLCRYIRGMHLHQSISGAYVRRHCGALPADFPKDLPEQYQTCYAHIQNIDRHESWTDPAVREIIDRVQPAYLTHELAAPDRQAKLRAARLQKETIGGQNNA